MYIWNPHSKFHPTNSTLSGVIMLGTNLKNVKTSPKMYFFKVMKSWNEDKKLNSTTTDLRPLSSQPSKFQLLTSIWRGGRRRKICFKAEKGRVPSISLLVTDFGDWFLDILCNFELFINLLKKEQFLRFMSLRFVDNPSLLLKIHQFLLVLSWVDDFYLRWRGDKKL